MTDPLIYLLTGLTVSLVTLAAGSIIVYTLKNGASPMPTAPRVKNVIMNLLSQIDRDGVIIDLGSGWGTLALSSAKVKPGSTVLGYENSLLPWLFSQVIAKLPGHANCSFRRRDFFTVSLCDADIILCYLHPRGMTKLAEKFNRELKAGTIIICNTFALPGWDAVITREAADLYHSKVFLYVAGKEKKHGSGFILQA